MSIDNSSLLKSFSGRGHPPAPRSLRLSNHHSGEFPQGVQIEGPGLCLQLTITAFPTLDGTDPEAAEELNKKMLQCTLRMQGKVSNPRVWVAEFLFRGM